MRLFYFFILLASACLLLQDVACQKLSSSPFAREKREFLPPVPSMEDGEDYDGEFDEEMEDRPLPIKTMPPQPREFPSYRKGFQQKPGMKIPTRLAPLPEEMEEDVEIPDPYGGNNGSMVGSTQLPPRDYPPKMPQLKFGQTEWNQMDLHSLVEGRKS